MMEYEVVYTFLNGCAGAAHPQRTFDEVEIANTDDYIRHKHSADFDQFTKEEKNGAIVYTYNNGTVCHIYEFTEL